MAAKQFSCVFLNAAQLNTSDCWLCLCICTISRKECTPKGLTWALLGPICTVQNPFGRSFHNHHGSAGTVVQHFVTDVFPLQAVLGHVPKDPIETPHARIGNAVSAREGKPLRKNEYKQAAEVSEMPESAVRAWLDERQIVVAGSSLRPIQQFSHSGAFTTVILKTIKQESLPT